jgi:hypothetical protein
MLNRWSAHGIPWSALNAQHSHVETSRLDVTEYSQKYRNEETTLAGQAIF